MPDASKYRPRNFTTTALQQAKVELTWDETDPNRTEIANRLLAGDSVDDHDLQAYLACSSGDEDEEEVVGSYGSIKKSLLYLYCYKAASSISGKFSNPLYTFLFI